MKVSVIGCGGSAIHERALANAFQRIGCEVDTFYWSHYFTTASSLLQPLFRAQNRLVIGPRLRRLSDDLVTFIADSQPAIVLIYRGTHVTATTIAELKRVAPNCMVIGYNNDDPFAPGHPPWEWRHFLGAIPSYDVVLAYREHNVRNYVDAGAKHVEVLRSWFVPELHRPVSPTEDERTEFGCECIFVGHYEDDGRDRYIEELIRGGVRVKVFGPFSGLGKSGWDRPVARSSLLRTLPPIRYLTGRSYVSALCSAPIALCFLSKLNRDTYTRRCFEIPACGTALFAEYTDDLATLFQEGQEAVFFRTPQELLEKVGHYLANRDQLDFIRVNGRERVLRDGHDIYSRAREVIRLAESL